MDYNIVKHLPQNTFFALFSNVPLLKIAGLEGPDRARPPVQGGGEHAGQTRQQDGLGHGRLQGQARQVQQVCQGAEGPWHLDGCCWHHCGSHRRLPWGQLPHRWGQQLRQEQRQPHPGGGGQGQGGAGQGGQHRDAHWLLPGQAFSVPGGDS